MSTEERLQWILEKRGTFNERVFMEMLGEFPYDDTGMSNIQKLKFLIDWVEAYERKVLQEA